MYTAFLIDKTLDLESYETLDAAIAEQLQNGWEEEADKLLSSPVLIRHDEDGTIAAVFTYTPDPDDTEHPLLCVHWTATNKLSLFRWHDTGDGYEGRLVHQSYMPALVTA